MVDVAIEEIDLGSKRYGIGVGAASTDTSPEPLNTPCEECSTENGTHAYANEQSRSSAVRPLADAVDLYGNMIIVSWKDDGVDQQRVIKADRVMREFAGSLQRRDEVRRTLRVEYVMELLDAR